MRKRFAKVLLLAGLIMAGAGAAHSAGFNIYEAGARATALGCAFTATADDGSALFYNPAGLSFQMGTKASLNFIEVGPRFKFIEATDEAGDPATGEAASNWYLVPGAYYTHNGGGKLSYGFGVYAPYGLGVEWLEPETWVGRQVSYDVSIETVYFTPAASFLLKPDLAFSIGLDVAHQTLELNKFSLNPSTGDNAIDTKIEGTGNLNVTPALGLMYRPTEEFSFGVMYHHKKTITYEDQDATLAPVSGSDFGETVVGNLGGSEQEISADFKIPYILSFGAAYRFCERVALEVDYVRFGWSHFDELKMDFANDALDQAIVFDYEDTWQVRAGLDFAVKPGKLNLMAGFVYDNTPQPLESVSPLLPDSDRKDYSFGAQYFHKKWEFTLSYMAVIADERTNIEDGRPANPDPAYPVGTYKNLANIWAVGIGYNF